MITCQRRGGSLIEECVCIDNAPNYAMDGKDVAVKMLNASSRITILGDCPHVVVNISYQEYSSKNHFLYLYRIGFLEIVAIDPNLRQLHILNSNVMFDHAGAFENARLNTLSLVGSVVSNIEENVFRNSHIAVLSLNGTTIHKIRDNAFAESIIDAVELWGSNVVSSSGDLLNRAQRLVRHIENSITTSNGFFVGCG